MPETEKKDPLHSFNFVTTTETWSSPCRADCLEGKAYVPRDKCNSVQSVLCGVAYKAQQRQIHPLSRPEKLALKEVHRQTLSNKGRVKGLSLMEQRGRKSGQMTNTSNSTDERNTCMYHEKGLVIFLKVRLSWGFCLLVVVVVLILPSEASLEEH